MTDTLRDRLTAKVADWRRELTQHQDVQSPFLRGACGMLRTVADEIAAVLAAPEEASSTLSPASVERVVTAISDVLGMTPDPWPNDDQMADFCQRVSRAFVRADAPEGADE